MLDEYNALVTNGTWVLVPRPANVNVVRSMWHFNHKFKARLVANGRSQQQGINYDETFSPVVKPAIIHTVLSLTVSRDWPNHQLDVKNAFIHGHLSKMVYMYQPLGFVDPTRPDYQSKTDASLFFYHFGSDMAYLLLYVDDMILIPSSTSLLQRIIGSLHGEFAIIDLGSLNYFLALQSLQDSDTESELGPDDDPVSDSTLYHSLVRISQKSQETVKSGQARTRESRRVQSRSQKSTKP
ncbi:ribonuclease H-like domain-containing protein [Tanacetum coccineum]